MHSLHLEVRNRFIAKRNGDTCYGLGEWRRYSAGAWESLPELKVKHEIQTIAAKVPSLAVTNSVVSSATELVRQCIGVSDLLFDSNPNIIVFNDCVLDLTTWTTVPHSPAHYATSKLTFSYDPDVRLDEWDRFLQHLPHPEFMRRFAGLCLTPETKYEVALWLWGPPGGGKSTYIEALCAMLGAKACVLGLSEIERSQFALSQLPGRTLAVSTELPGRLVRASHIINAIISGELMPVERKYLDPYTIRPHAKIIWGMNVLPSIGMEGIGMFRRILPVHFPAVPEPDRDPKLKEAILRSPMAVANWSLGGLREVQATHSLSIPVELVAARDIYREANDLTLNFVSECCEKDPEKQVKMTTLYLKFKVWATRTGHRPRTIQEFKSDLDRLGFINIRPHNVSYWRGLTLVDDSDLDSDIVIDG
jgi:putative DNA primase/helicase